MFKWEKQVIGIILLGFIGLTVLLYSGLFLIERARCASQATALGLPFSWGPMQGCIVARQDGVRVPIENYGRADRD